jgi:hypothetical protein
MNKIPSLAVMATCLTFSVSSFSATVQGATQLRPLVSFVGADTRIAKTDYLRITTREAWAQVWLEHIGKPGASVQGDYGKQLGVKGHAGLLGDQPAQEVASQNFDPSAFPVEFHQEVYRRVFRDSMEKLKSKAAGLGWIRPSDLVWVPSFDTVSAMANYAEYRLSLSDWCTNYYDQAILNARLLTLDTWRLPPSTNLVNASAFRRYLQALFETNQMSIVEFDKDRIALLMTTNLSKFKFAAGHDLYQNPSGAPEIDFDKCMVVAITAGPGNGVAGIKIVSISETAGSVTLDFDLLAYQHFAGASAAGNAYGFFVLPRTAKALVLRKNAANSTSRLPPVWKEVKRFEGLNPPVTK